MFRAKTVLILLLPWFVSLKKSISTGILFVTDFGLCLFLDKKMSYQSVLGLRLRATPVSSPSFLPKQQQQQQQQQQSQARRRSQPANGGGGGDGKLREVGGNSFFPSLYNMPAHCPQSEISILRTMHKFCDKDFF